MSLNDILDRSFNDFGFLEMGLLNIQKSFVPLGYEMRLAYQIIYGISRVF